MTYKELAEHLSKLNDEQSNTEVTFYDDSNGRYYPANSLEVIDIEPTFPPLVYLTLAPDVMISIKAWQISNCPLFSHSPWISLIIRMFKRIQPMNTSLSKEVYEQLVNPTPTIRYYFLSNLSTKSTTKGGKK